MLAYHAVPDPDRFDVQLGHLADHYSVVSLAQVLAAQHGAIELPPWAVLITFDDGDPTVVDHGLPLLRARGLPAVAFVIAGLIDTTDPPWWIEAEELAVRAGVEPAPLVRRCKQVRDHERRARLAELRASVGPPSPRRNLTSDEVRTLAAGGMAIGSHSFTHPCLDKCTDATIEEELRRAHDRLTDLLEAPPRAIAYPNGNEDRRVTAAARGLGYQAGFLFDHRLARFPASDPLRISRLRVDSARGLDHFRIKVSGLHPLAHRVRGRS